MGVNGPAGPHITAALAHIAGGRIEVAYAAVQQAFVLEPNNSLVHKIFGQVFARRQPPRPDLAQNAYDRSLQLYADDAETHKLLGDVFFFLRQQPTLAIPYYTQSIKLNEKDGETHLRLGQCYERTNQLDIALRAYQEAAIQAPKHIPNHLALGYLALRINRLPIAEQAFVQALVLNPADYQTRFVLSQVYERENRLEEAFQQCGHVVGPLSATNPAVSQMYQRLRIRLGR
jgi:tetratricopeptide (TPR) repeat protein